jgi:hypothetical protein
MLVLTVMVHMLMCAPMGRRPAAVHPKRYLGLCRRAWRGSVRGLQELREDGQRLPLQVRRQRVPTDYSIQQGQQFLAACTWAVWHNGTFHRMEWWTSALLW